MYGQLSYSQSNYYQLIWAESPHTSPADWNLICLCALSKWKWMQSLPLENNRELGFEAQGHPRYLKRGGKSWLGTERLCVKYSHSSGNGRLAVWSDACLPRRLPMELTLMLKIATLQLAHMHVPKSQTLRNADNCFKLIQTIGQSSANTGSHW